MNNNMYDQFGEDYDRFVNWEARLSVEMPFLVSQLTAHQVSVGRSIHILDVACGTGEHVIALAKQGFSIAGADFSEEMVGIAQQKAELASQTGIIFKQAGFTEASTAFSDLTFDALLCLGNSLPHVADDSDLDLTLADFYDVLVPGGMLLLQSRNFDQVLATKDRWMPPQTYHDGSQTWLFTRFYDFEPDNHIQFNILILKGEKALDFEQKIISTRLWPITQESLESALMKIGFTDIRHFGDLQGSKFDVHQSGNLVTIAKK